MGTEFQVYKVNSVPEVDGAEGYTAMCMYLI